MRTFKRINESFEDMYIDGKFKTIFSDNMLEEIVIGSPFGNEPTPCNVHVPYTTPLYIWETQNNGCIRALSATIDRTNLDYEVISCRNGIDDVIERLPVSETEVASSQPVEGYKIIILSDFVYLGYEGMSAILDIIRGKAPYVLDDGVRFIFHSILPVGGVRNRWDAPDSFIKNFKIFEYDPRRDYYDTGNDDYSTKKPEEFASFIERTRPNKIYVSFKYGRYILTVDYNDTTVSYLDDAGKKSAKAGNAQTIEGVWNRIDAAGDLYNKGIRYIADEDGNLVPESFECMRMRRKIDRLVRNAMKEMLF